MRKGFGIVCLLLGVICLLGATGLVIYNRWEEENAAQTSQELLEDVQLVIQQNKETSPAGETVSEEAPAETVAVPTEMATIRVNGYDCIGILSIPVLELELPVLADWSYEKLMKAPCHYYGAYYETDFVIAAHNYNSHFGRLSELQQGDVIVFTDANGNEYFYEVVLLETLPKNATQEMIASGFDLSLYTCTIGGSNRVTVRCNTIPAQ